MKPAGTSRSLLLDRLAQGICRRGIEAPALVALNIARPFGLLGSHMLLGFEPVLHLLVDRRHILDYATLLEDDTAYNELIERIERYTETEERQ